jgi:hypothetical protein
MKTETTLAEFVRTYLQCAIDGATFEQLQFRLTIDSATAERLETEMRSTLFATNQGIDNTKKRYNVPEFLKRAEPSLAEFTKRYCEALRDGLTIDALSEQLRLRLSVVRRLDREMRCFLAKHNDGLQETDNDYFPVPLKLRAFKWTREVELMMREHGISRDEVLGIATI